MNLMVISLKEIKEEDFFSECGSGDFSTEDGLNPQFVEFEKIFDDTCVAGKEIFVERSKSYNVSFRRMGMLGIAAEINGIAGKIQNMLYGFMRTGTIDLDRLNDALYDLHNYSAIGRICVEEDNLIGVEYKAE